jgi:hypothetical protein
MVIMITIVIIIQIATWSKQSGVDFDLYLDVNSIQSDFTLNLNGYFNIKLHDSIQQHYDIAFSSQIIFAWDCISARFDSANLQWW